MSNKPEEQWPGDASPETTIRFGAISASDDADVAAETTKRDSVESLPATSALLIVQRGPNVGARFLLDQDRTTVGRRESSDIFLDDVTVSRAHAEFIRNGTQFTVQDVGSLNGTYVNRERIDTTFLTAGDEVQIGKFRMVFHTGDQHGLDGAADA